MDATHVHLDGNVSIHYVSPEGIMLQPQYCVLKAKEQRKEKLTCLDLFCFSYESEAGPVIQYMMRCGNYIVSSFFLQNVNTVYTVYVEQENVMCC